VCDLHTPVFAALKISTPLQGMTKYAIMEKNGVKAFRRTSAITSRIKKLGLN